MKFEYHDREAEKEKLRLEQAVSVSSTDVLEEFEDEEVDFTKEIMNEKPETQFTLSPTYGVNLDFKETDDGTEKQVQVGKKKQRKIFGKTYKERPSVHSKLTKTEYLEIRKQQDKQLGRTMVGFKPSVDNNQALEYTNTRPQVSQQKSRNPHFNIQNRLRPKSSKNGISEIPNEYENFKNSEVLPEVGDKHRINKALTILVDNHQDTSTRIFSEERRLGATSLVPRDSENPKNFKNLKNLKRRKKPKTRVLSGDMTSEMRFEQRQSDFKGFKFLGPNKRQSIKGVMRRPVKTADVGPNGGKRLGQRNYRRVNVKANWSFISSQKVGRDRSFGILQYLLYLMKIYSFSLMSINRQCKI